jgi:hypothetical protein
LTFPGNPKAARGGALALFACVGALLVFPALASAANGQIAGTVTRFYDSAAVSGAVVCATPEAGGAAVCATTAGGAYEITELEPGPYFVEFNSGGSVPELRTQFWNGADSAAAATAVTVADGVQTSGINAALKMSNPVGRIQGTATLVGGALQGVQACAIASGATSCAATAATGPFGTYELAGLAPGPYTVEFTRSDLPSETSPATVSEGIATSGVNAAYGQVKGHVYASDGLTPVASSSACVIQPVDLLLKVCTSTNAAGAYALNVVPGTYKVGFSIEYTEYGIPAPPAGTLGGADGWRTQFWNMKPTPAQAEAIAVNGQTPVAEIDARLEPTPGGVVPDPTIKPTSGTTASAPTITPTVVVAAKKAVHCGKGRRKVKKAGKTRCVPIHHKHKHKKKQRAAR